MVHNPIDALDEAIAGLEAAFLANPDYVLLRSLLEARRAYGKPAKPLTEEGDRTIEGKKAPKRRKMDPKREQAVKLATEYLTGKRGPVKTKEISAFVIVSGCLLNGNPENNLASLLLRRPEFVSHGRAGWTLASAAGASEDNASESPEATGDLLTQTAPVASNSSPGLTNGETWVGTA